MFSATGRPDEMGIIKSSGDVGHWHFCSELQQNGKDKCPVGVGGGKNDSCGRRVSVYR